MLASQNLILDKLQKQKRPQIVFADIDGTLFTAGLQIIKAPFYNTKTTSYLRSHSIPLVLVTGRSDWQDVDKIQTQLLGINQPDAVITACGSVIYERLETGMYARDLVWESLMQYTKVTWIDGIISTWNKLDTTHMVTDYLKNHTTPFRLGTGNTFLIRIKVSKMPVKQLEQIRKDILMLFPQGLRVVFTEKLLWENTTDIFSGDILVMPKNAGKENAIKYLLEKYGKQLEKPLHALVFGDATVDVGMLSMKVNPKNYSLSQHLVNPTPLAKKAITTEMKTNENVSILEGDGPEEIWKVVTCQPSTLKRESLSSNTIEPTLLISPTTSIDNKLSPAQNNPARQIIKRLEPLLDKLVDKNLSPNEVSFLGLTQLSEGLNLLYQQKNSPIQKVKGLYKYGFGNLADVLDGVRARHSDKREENGQLVDGFSDRAKEFIQLFARAKKRIVINKEEGLQTLLTAFSCALPSISRAQVEITGGVVPERDEKGGSMVDRTKKLFMSLLMDTIGAHRNSMTIDYKIYSSNIATFHHRLSYAKKISLSKIAGIETASLSEFQKKALERWLLYIDVLQQEDTIINKYLFRNPQLLKEYEKQSQKLAKGYLDLPINRLRKKWVIEDYKLKINTFLL